MNLLPASGYADVVRLVVVVVLLSFVSCQRPPCLEEVQHTVFAVRGPLPPDAGTDTCPEILEGTLDVLSTTTAHFAFDGGIEGDCTLSTLDNRAQRAGCQATLSCTWSRGAFIAFSFVDPERQELIDGTDGPMSKADLLWRADGCEATYSWAAAPRGAP